MNPICKIWAHDYEDDCYNSPYGVFRCKRCGTVTDYNEDYDAGSLNLAGKLWRKWRRTKDWFTIKPATRNATTAACVGTSTTILAHRFEHDNHISDSNLESE